MTQHPGLSARQPRSEAPGNTTKATTLQGTTGQADKQQSNHAVKHKAAPTRQPNYKARKRTSSRANMR
ncbi:hypothetical protein CBR_g28671 [Chara braunii]|uniref:Uncharacterized protein n=1 Tax=Chara braunii TaxID=69332 RepID=A0A388L9G7_CHABU|nr:hypothetical protein CBR_g28671 [Chara braunii]|eukprot:GBG78957.1 hypothetical protein CBR_g28671 [Chara braunii]